MEEREVGVNSRVLVLRHALKKAEARLEGLNETRSVLPPGSSPAMATREKAKFSLATETRNRLALQLATAENMELMP
jgi:hypothetical protein